MTLCCTANSDINRMLTTSASASGAGVPLSMVFGTSKPLTKPMA